jgi:transposase
MEYPMLRPKDDLSRSLVAFNQNTTIVATVELSSRTWLVGGVVPGLARDPLKKLASDENALLKLLYRWRDEGRRAGQKIKRIVVAFEAGRCWCAEFKQTV